MGQCRRQLKSDDLVELCIALGKAMYKQADQFLSAYGLTPSQFEILSILSEEGDIPLNRVSERLCCACSNVTGLVDHLERDGLVKRQRSEEDRRVILLGLTEKGQEMWKTVPSSGCCGVTFKSILNREEESEFRRIVKKLLSAMA
jgi:DNA-binding MarR family transcriptional regulator